MSRFEVFVGGADAGRTGGWVVAALGVGVGAGMIGAGVGGYSGGGALVFVFGFFDCGLGCACFFWPGCAMELPRALKKSPSEPACAFDARTSTASKAAIKFLLRRFTEAA